MLIYQDGNVGNNIKYKDICLDKYAVTFAHVYSGEFVNNSMVEDYYFSDKHGGKVGFYTNIPYEYELIIPFLENNNVIGTWSDSHYIWGEFNETTGLWTGNLGQVNLLLQIFVKLQVQVKVHNQVNPNIQQ